MFSFECSRICVKNEVQKNYLDLSVHSRSCSKFKSCPFSFFNKGFKANRRFFIIEKPFLVRQQALAFEVIFLKTVIFLSPFSCC